MRGFNREFAFRTDSTDGLADDVARSLQRHVDEHDRAANTHPRCVSCFVGDVSVSTVVPLIARVPSGGLQLGRISVVATVSFSLTIGTTPNPSKVSRVDQALRYEVGRTRSLTVSSTCPTRNP